MSRIYVASSWRNVYQPPVVGLLRDLGHEVYDFRNPPDGAGFGWEEVMPYAPGLSDEVGMSDYLEALQHPRAVEGYAADLAAMQWADTFVLVLPCGRSAHLELGWAVGAGKRTVIYIPTVRVVPELMYRMVSAIATDPRQLREAVSP